MNMSNIFNSDVDSSNSCSHISVDNLETTHTFSELDQLFEQIMKYQSHLNST